MGSEKLDITMNQEEDDSVVATNYCRDHIRGFCARENCRYLHETPPKSFLKVLFKFCHDFQNKGCFRQNCKFVHADHDEEEHFYATGSFPRDPRPIPVCQAYLHNSCNNQDCKYVHPPDLIENNRVPGVNTQQQPVNWRTNSIDEDVPPGAKMRRIMYDDTIEKALLSGNNCSNCNALEHKNQLLHENISILLKKIASLNEKNDQLTTMNEFLLEQSASVRNEHSCVITSRHGTSAPVSLATVSMTPVVSLAGAIPALLPATATPNLTLAPASSGAQLLTPAPQILTVSTTQQLMGNSGALIVTSAGAQQLMQVSDSGTLMGAPGQTVVAVTPAQLTIAPPAQQLMSGASQNAVQQLVQQSALPPQLAQHQNQFAAQQSVQHLAARQSAQHLAQHSAQHLAAQQSAQHLAQQSAQHLARQSAQHLAQQSAQHLVQQSAQHLAQQSAQHLAQQSAQHLAQQSAQHLAQQSAQHLAQQSAHLAAQQSAQLAAAQQSAQQQMVAQQSAQQQAAQQTAQQQLVQQTAQQQLVQQITISSTSQSMAMPNSQAQTLTFPIISQSILPH